MHFRNKFLSIAAVTMSAMMAFSPVLGANAAEGMTYDPITGEEITIEKYLVMNESAITPAVSFHYEVVAGEAQKASGSNLEVYAGNDGNTSSGLPVIGTADFSYNQEQFSEAQASENSKIMLVEGANDSVELEEDEVYSRSSVSVDFSNVKFMEPGVYRYIVKETYAIDLADEKEHDGSSMVSFSFDEDMTRVLDVYVVEDGEGALEVQGYVLHNSDDNATVDKEASYDTKGNGFQNEYNTRDLSFTKTVSGNQASHDEYFEVVLKIEGALPNTVYAVDISEADASTKTNGVNTEAKENQSSITTDADGNAEATFWVQGGTSQSITVEGLPFGTKYSVSQNKETMGEEGYSTTITSTDDDPDNDPDNFTTGGDIGGGDPDEIKITFEDNRSGVIPTGIILSVVPGAAIVAGSAIGLIAMAAKKKDEDEEEE